MLRKEIYCALYLLAEAQGDIISMIIIIIIIDINSLVDKLKERDIMFDPNKI